MIELLDKKVCTICGQEVPITAGHYVPTLVSDGDSMAVGEAEFHCLVCDPIVIEEEQPKTYSDSDN